MRNRGTRTSRSLRMPLQLQPGVRVLYIRAPLCEGFCTGSVVVEGVSFLRLRACHCRVWGFQLFLFRVQLSVQGVGATGSSESVFRIAYFLYHLDLDEVCDSLNQPSAALGMKVFFLTVPYSSSVFLGWQNHPSEFGEILNLQCSSLNCPKPQPQAFDFPDLISFFLFLV